MATPVQLDSPLRPKGRVCSNIQLIQQYRLSLHQQLPVLGYDLPVATAWEALFDLPRTRLQITHNTVHAIV